MSTKERWQRKTKTSLPWQSSICKFIRKLFCRILRLPCQGLGGGWRATIWIFRTIFVVSPAPKRQTQKHVASPALSLFSRKRLRLDRLAVICLNYLPLRHILNMSKSDPHFGTGNAPALLFNVHLVRTKDGRQRRKWRRKTFFLCNMWTASCVLQK